MIGTYFTASLALLCLFLPKFWGILKSYKVRDENDTTHSWRGKESSRERQPRPGSSGYHLADGNSAGGGVSSTSGLGGNGGGGGGGANASLTAPSAVRLASTRARTTSLEQGAQTTRSRRKSEVLSVASSSTQEKYSSNPIDLWMSSQLPRKRTGVGPLSSNKSSASSIRSGILPQPQFVRGDFRDDTSLGKSGTGGGSGGKTSRGRQLEEGGMLGQDSTHLTFQPGLDINSTQALQEFDSGNERCMESFVFLVPIRVRRGWITSILSHWSMATLILIPEAHAFLALDSADKKSTSYLMTSMAQDHSAPDPTIRVTTCHSGTLYIQFDTQSRLDVWMGLFDDEDLVALRPRSMSVSMLPTKALTSSFDQLPPQTYQPPPSSSTWRRGSSVGSSTMLLNEAAAGIGSVHVQDMDHRIGESSSSQHGSKDRTGSLGNLLSSASTLVGGVEGWKATRPIFGENDVEVSNLKHLPMATTTATAGIGGGEANGQMRSRVNMSSTTYSAHPLHNGRGGGLGGAQCHPTVYHNPFAFDGGGHEHEPTLGNPHTAPGEKPYFHNNNSNNDNSSNVKEIGNIFAAAGDTAPMADPRASRQRSNNSSTTNDIQFLRTISSMPSSIIPTLSTAASQSQQSQQPQLQQQPQTSTLYNAFPFSTTLAGDDDDEDLYDPEFGIGGNGRRRFRHRISTASSARSSMAVDNNNNEFGRPPRPPRPLGGYGTRIHQQQQQRHHTAAMIPSTTAISTAAAACAAGWSESDALAAATADPYGNFLAGYTPQPSEQSNPLASGRGGNLSSDIARGSLDRKGFSKLRQSNKSLSTGLSLLTAGGRRSLGQIFSDHSSGDIRNSKNKSFSPSAQRSPEVIPDKLMNGGSIAGSDRKVLSYSQYLEQTQAAKLAETEAAHQSQQLPPPIPVPVAALTTTVPISPPTPPPVPFQTTVSNPVALPIQAQAIVKVASPLTDRNEIMPPQ
ncbi:hypothetical protein BGZ95_001629 [Linnemannia exigua]|uniref:PH domain-containing protein n=1 Tax=Linnemannia exigua TaxID=604196 RepID=A0AAD4D711_9FUNG|nr:hypothetical protein BGZ95_001629 [Linnemannia exigua]